MPEFKRGWGRWLPRAAERDLFHPSLEDLRAEHVKGVRLQIAIVALWVECWRVWLVGRTDPAPKGAGYIRRKRHVRNRRQYVGMVMQDVRRALRVFRMEPG